MRRVWSWVLRYWEELLEVAIVGLLGVMLGWLILWAVLWMER